jgi:dipeptidase E
LVLNALDNAPDVRATFSESQRQGLESMGIEVAELDLRKYFGDADNLSTVLQEYSALWITGGNAFVLRKAMRQSGFDPLIKQILSEDRIVYAGFSAAAVVTYEHLRGLRPSASACEPLEGYQTELVWEGLNITPYAIVVHYDSDHPGRDQAEEEANYYRQHGIPFHLVRDGQALVVDGDVTELVGSVASET